MERYTAFKITSQVEGPSGNNYCQLSTQSALYQGVLKWYYQWPLT